MLGLDSSGNPVSAKIEITQPHAPLKPLGQVVWSPDQSVTYYNSNPCVIHEK